MSREGFDIVITEKGAAKVTKNIAGIGKTSTQSASGVDFLKNALKTFAGAAAVKQIVSIAVGYTNMQNRLKNVTSNSAELTVVTKELFAIANRTRSSFEGTAEIYARTSLALKDVGISQEETLQFTESLNQAIILSGASAIEAKAGLIQLSQGLASGTLRGDELRSVLEQLPAVSDVIAKSMGITRGELRDLGTQGKITSKIILQAFKEARVELEEKFGKIVPTVGQAFQVLKNNFTQYVGEIDTSKGATASLAKGIILLASHMDTLARLALTAAIAIGVHLAKQGVGTLILAIKSLGLAIKANPLGALLTVIVLIGSAIVAFSDKLQLAEGGVANLQDLFAVTFSAIQSSITTVTAFLAEQFGGAFEVIRKTFEDTEVSFKGVITFLAKGADVILGTFVGTFKAIMGAFGGLPNAIRDLSTQAFNSLVSQAESAVNKIIRVINPILKFAGGAGLAEITLSRLENVAAGSLRNLGVTVKDAFLEGFDTKLVENTVLGLFNKAEDRAKKRLVEEEKQRKREKAARDILNRVGVDKTKIKDVKTTGPTSTTILADLKTQNELLQINTRERQIVSSIIAVEEELKRKLSETEKGLIANLLVENRKLEEQSAILDEINGPLQNFEVRLDALNQLYAKGKVGIEDYTQKLIDLKLESLQVSRTLEGGLERGLLQIGKQFGDVSRLAETTVVNAFGSAEDALVDFATTGKLSIKSMVDSIFKDLTRLAIRQAITGPIANAIGGGTAGAGGGGGFGALFSAAAAAFGGSGGGAGGGGAAGGAGAIAAAAAAGGGGGGMFGFKDGGQFRVGGSGGPDSQLVAFKASPDETVKISKPGQGGSPINVTFNIQTPDVESFERNQNQILARTSAALSRANRRNN